jgi:hypothetical protein
VTGELIDATKLFTERRVMSEVKNQCLCPACGHGVDDVDDWGVATDEDSGIHACTNCNELLDSSVFDDMVKVETKPIPMIVANIPVDYVAELVEQFEGKGFQLGHAILNAKGVRETLVALTSETHAQYMMATDTTQFDHILDRAKKIRKEIKKNG